jgi:hypothetical protein
MSGHEEQHRPEGDPGEAHGAEGSHGGGRELP